MINIVNQLKGEVSKYADSIGVTLIDGRAFYVQFVACDKPDDVDYVCSAHEYIDYCMELSTGDDVCRHLDYLSNLQ